MASEVRASTSQATGSFEKFKAGLDAIFHGNSSGINVDKVLSEKGFVDNDSILAVQKQYQQAQTDGVVAQDKFSKAFDNKKIEAYFKTLNGAPATLSGLRASLQAAEGAQRGFSMSVIGSKIAMIGAEIAAIALNTAITMGVGFLITAAITAFDNYANRVSNAKDALVDTQSKIDEVNSELRTQEAVVKKSGKNYAELAQGVNQFNNTNLSLSDGDYEEFLNLSTELANIFPELVKGYDDNGNAILNLNGNVKEVTNSLAKYSEQAKEAAALKLSDIFQGKNGNEDFFKNSKTVMDEKVKQRDGTNDRLNSLKTNGYINKTGMLGEDSALEDTFNRWVQLRLSKATQAEKDMYKRSGGEDTNTFGKIDAAIKAFDELKGGADYGNGFEETDYSTGYLIKFDSSKVSKDLDLMQQVIDAQESLKINAELELKQQNSLVSTQAQSILQSSPVFQKFNKDIQKAVSGMLSNIDWSYVDASTGEEAATYIKDNFINKISAIPNDAIGNKDKKDISNFFNLPKDIGLETYLVEFNKLKTLLSKYSIDIPIGYIVQDPNTVKDELIKNDTLIKQSSTPTNDELAKVWSYRDKNSIDSVEEFQIWNQRTEGAKTAAEAIKMYEAEAKKVKDTSTITLEDIFKDSSFANAKKELFEFAKAGELTPEKLSKYDLLNAKLKEAGISAKDASTYLLNTLTYTQKLSALQTGLGKVKSVYQSFEENKFVDATSLESLKDVFGKLPSFDLFSKIVGDPKKGKAKIKAAFNSIVTEYIKDQNTIVDVTEETKNTYIANLKESGVANAKAIIDEQLKVNKENRKLLTEGAKNYIEYLNAKGLSTAEFNNATTGLNSNLINAIGSQYGIDLSNWNNLLQEKAKAYNIFVDAIKKSGINLPSPQVSYTEKEYKEARKKILSEKYVPKVPVLGYDWGKDAFEKSQKAKLAALDEAQNNYNSANKKAQDAENKKNKSEKDTLSKLNKVNVKFTSSYKPKSTGSGSDKTATKEFFDYIEIRLKNLSETTSRIKDNISRIFSDISKENTIKNLIKTASNEYNELKKANKKYSDKASSIKISNNKKDDVNIKRKIRDGSLSWETLSGSQATAAKNYQDWWNKADEADKNAKDKYKEVLDARYELTEFYIEKQKKALEKFDDKRNEVQKSMDLKVAKGGTLSTEDYKKQIEIEKNAQKQAQANINTNNKKMKQLQDANRVKDQKELSKKEKAKNNVEITELKNENKKKGISSKQKEANLKKIAQLEAANKRKTTKALSFQEKQNNIKQYNLLQEENKENANKKVDAQIAEANLRQSILDADFKRTQDFIEKKNKSFQDSTNNRQKTKGIIALKEAQGKTLVASDYTSQNTIEAKDIKDRTQANKEYQSEITRLQNANKVTGKKALSQQEKDNNVKRIEELQNAYRDNEQAINDSNIAIEQNNQLINQLPIEKYKSEIEALETINGLLKSQYDLNKKLGTLTEADYTSQIDTNNQEIIKQQGIFDKQKLLFEQYSKEGKDELANTAKNAMNESLTSINGLLLANLELKDSLREEIYYKAFNDMATSIENARNKLQTLNSLFYEEMLRDKDGNLTDYGIAYLENLVDDSTNAVKAVQNAENKLSSIKRENYSSDEEFQKAIDAANAERDSALQDSFNSKKAVVEFMLDSYKGEIEKLKELTKARLDAFNAKKSYYDYDKQIKEKTKDIKALERQAKALEGVTTAEAKAEKQRIQSQLENAKTELTDMQFNHEMEIITDVLNKFSENLDKDYESFADSVKSFEGTADLLARAVKLIGNSGVDTDKIEDEAIDNAGGKTNAEKEAEIVALNKQITALQKEYNKIAQNTDNTSQAKKYSIAQQITDLETKRDNLKAAYGFKTGGIVKSIANSKGEDGLAYVRDGEGLIMPEHVPLLQDTLENMHNLHNLTDTIVKLSDSDFQKFIGMSTPIINNHYDSLINVNGSIDKYIVDDVTKLTKDIIKQSHEYSVEQFRSGFGKLGNK